MWPYTKILLQKEGLLLFYFIMFFWEKRIYSLETADKNLVQEILTCQGIKDAYDQKSPRLAEYICKLLILDRPRKMFIEGERGTPTFQTIMTRLKNGKRTALLRSVPNQSIRKTSLEYTWQAHKKVWDNLSSEAMEGLHRRVGQ